MRHIDETLKYVNETDGSVTLSIRASNVFSTVIANLIANVALNTNGNLNQWTTYSDIACKIVAYKNGNTPVEHPEPVLAINSKHKFSIVAIELLADLYLQIGENLQHLGGIFVDGAELETIEQLLELKVAMRSWRTDNRHLCEY